MTKVDETYLDNLMSQVEALREPRITMDKDLARDIFHELKMWRVLANKNPLDLARCYMVQELTMDYARVMFADHVLDWTDIVNEHILKEISDRIIKNVYLPDSAITMSTSVMRS